jgi:hypothetical protein
MALSVSELKSKIVSELQSAYGSPEDSEVQSKFAEAIAKAVIDHITSSATVTVQSGIPVSTTGGPAAQTGATTGPGTGSIS